VMQAIYRDQETVFPSPDRIKAAKNTHTCAWGEVIPSIKKKLNSCESHLKVRLKRLVCLIMSLERKWSY